MAVFLRCFQLRKQVSLWCRAEKEINHDPKMRTAFRRTSKLKNKTLGAAEQQKVFDRKMEEWKRFAEILNPPIVKPVRTVEELEEAKRMTLMYKRRRMQSDRAFHREESKVIRLKRLAMEEVPGHLKAAAETHDTEPMPRNFIIPTWDPPVEGEEMFGSAQEPGKFRTLGDFGAMPYPYRPPKKPWL
eukprot:TRINITY_DN24226_c0_g1_i1.p1 TRINITY_DN24226_c0_g1~~TRINITY_DN24226_c0_g1_i1.p1  ORF type:complete len:187 (-),score=37.48 TRINITY_DN24226_c0_g1_i1:63-623(-)